MRPVTTGVIWGNVPSQKLSLCTVGVTAFPALLVQAVSGGSWEGCKINLSEQ